MLTMQNGGVAAVTLDYLRPEAAPYARRRTPADRRYSWRHRDRPGRAEGDAHHRRRSRPARFPLTPQTDIFTQFARSLRGEAPPPLTLHEACRITEIAIKAQQAADTGRAVSLRDDHLPHELSDDPSSTV